MFSKIGLFFRSLVLFTVLYWLGLSCGNANLSNSKSNSKNPLNDTSQITSDKSSQNISNGTSNSNPNSTSNSLSKDINPIVQGSKSLKIGFLDAFEDITIEQAKQGFLNALKDSGYIENKNFELIYKNAQGSPITMNQEISYFLSKNVTLIATNTTLSTIATAQKTKKIPIFMMVSPSVQMMGLEDPQHHPPKNLFGVYENLNYIDTSILLVKQLVPNIKTLGAIYSQGESQSISAYQHLKDRCATLGITLHALPVNNSSETHLIVERLISTHIDAFFALPDNSVFSSFETILNSCFNSHIPIFTSEEGLVKRGALAAFGADIYAWGYQSGKQAARYLKSGSVQNIQPEIVNLRRKVYNVRVASALHITIPKGIIPLK